MIQVYDKLLTEEQISDLSSNSNNLKFSTIVYDENGTIPLILSTEKGVSVGEIQTEIKNMSWDDKQ
jgi:hypothetical protein